MLSSLSVVSLSIGAIAFGVALGSKEANNKVRLCVTASAFFAASSVMSHLV